MKNYKLLALTAMLALAGCATPPGPQAPVASMEPARNQDVPAKVAEAVPPLPAVIPTGPLSVIQPADLSSAPVASLEPPSDLWARIRGGFKMPTVDSNLVRQHEQWYASRPDYMQRMTDRSRKYLFHIVEELERRNMPTELALLPFIESAFNPQAVSSARAAGMWQFMPATGKDFALKQNFFRDDRRSVLESTRAALDYLQKLHGMFGDWHLALAAYNWGEGNVSRAVQRSQRSGRAGTYADLRMPEETRHYVPKLQAVKNIITNPEQFNAELPAIDNHPYFQSVTLQRDMDVELAARLADVNLDDFKALNPQLKRPVILAAGTPQILLPWDNATVFKRNFDAYSEGKYASWTAWSVPATMSASEAARRVGMNEADLRAANSIPPRMLIKSGSVLIVPRRSGSQNDVASHVADHGQLSLAPERSMRRMVIRAGKRDSVASVARRYKLTPAQVAEWNDVGPSAGFRAGQQVVLHVPSRGGARAPVRMASRNVVRTSSHAASSGRAKPHASGHRSAAPAKKKRH